MKSLSSYAYHAVTILIVTALVWASLASGKEEANDQFSSPNVKNIKITYFDSQNYFAVLNHGTSSGIRLKDRVCFHNLKGIQLFCAAIVAALRDISGIYLTPQQYKNFRYSLWEIIGKSIEAPSRAEVAPKMPSAISSPLEAPIEYDDPVLHGAEPFFITKDGRRLVIAKPESLPVDRATPQSFSIGYFTTFRSPTSYNRVFYSPPVDTRPKGSLWDEKGTRQTSSWCFAGKYTSAPKNNLNYITTAYFRLYDYLEDEQNYIPMTADAFVRTTQKAYALGTALDRVHSQTANDVLNLLFGYGLGLERSLVDFRAKSYGAGVVEDRQFADYVSELYLLSLRLTGAFRFDFPRFGLGITANILYPLISKKGTENAKVSLPEAAGFTYSNDPATNIARAIQHRKSAYGAELMFDVLYILQ